MIGELDDKTLDHVSQSGKTVREGITALGGNPDHLEGARRARGDIAAYLELHIEQGGILDSRKIPIGIVEGIVGIARWDVTIEGAANHAGTTPMDQRRDALLAAARLILEANRIVMEEPGSQVGTVGRIQAEPGAASVIPDRWSRASSSAISPWTRSGRLQRIRPRAKGSRGKQTPDLLHRDRRDPAHLDRRAFAGSHSRKRRRARTIVP
jgi:hypothetical protein